MLVSFLLEILSASTPFVRAIPKPGILGLRVYSRANHATPYTATNATHHHRSKRCSTLAMCYALLSEAPDVSGPELTTLVRASRTVRYRFLPVQEITHPPSRA